LNNFCYSEESIENAVDIMNRTHSHKVYVEQDSESKTFCGFITYEHIFDFFINNYYADMKYLESVQIKELDICKKSIIKANKEESILSCFLSFEKNNKISMLPIMNGEEVFGYLFLIDFVYLFNFTKEIDVILINHFYKHIYHTYYIDNSYC